MRKFMDEARFRKINSGTEITLVKRKCQRKHTVDRLTSRFTVSHTGQGDVL